MWRTITDIIKNQWTYTGEWPLLHHAWVRQSPQMYKPLSSSGHLLHSEWIEGEVRKEKSNASIPYISHDIAVAVAVTEKHIHSSPTLTSQPLIQVPTREASYWLAQMKVAGTGAVCLFSFPHWGSWSCSGPRPISFTTSQGSFLSWDISFPWTSTSTLVFVCPLFSTGPSLSFS